MSKICGYSCEHNKSGVCQISVCDKKSIMSDKTEVQTFTRYIDPTITELQQENQELKKQLENKYEKIGTLTGELLYEENTKLINQQKEFIEWLETMNRMYENEYKDIDAAEHYNCVLQKYKSIIGDDK